MKPSASILTAAVLMTCFRTPVPAAEGSGFAPAARPLSAYDHLNRKSPFEFDPPATPIAPVSDPFDGVSLAGYCGSGSTLTVYLLTGGKEAKRVSVYGDGSALKKRDGSGYRVIGINRGSTLKATSVTLEKDGVTKEIGFTDETLRPGKAVPLPASGGRTIPGPGPIPVPPATGSKASPPHSSWQATLPVIPGQTNTNNAPVPIPAGAGNPAPGAGSAGTSVVPATNPRPLHRRIVLPAGN